MNEIATKQAFYIGPATLLCLNYWHFTLAQEFFSH